jgi:hypothetical protein
VEVPAPPPLPARAALREAGLHVALANIAPTELHDPFLQDTLKRIPSDLTLAHVPTPERVEADAGTAPSGLIFHVARCGSTLVSQLLKLQPGLTVYSEPPAFNELLAPGHPASRAALVGSLREVAALFSRHAGGAYVIKLSSWNVLFCDVLAEAFPCSPWALCLRDPVEVCVSLQSRPPGWLKAPTSPLRPYLGLRDGTANPTPSSSVAHAFASFCDAAQRLDPTRGTLVHYEDLPSATWKAVLPQFGMQVDESVIERMQAASRVDAKAPVGQSTPFARDTDRKQMAASAELRGDVETIARPAWLRLLRRMSQATAD